MRRRAPSALARASSLALAAADAIEAPARVAPTLVEAVRALADDDRARASSSSEPDGTERFCSFHDIAAEAERRGAHFAARGLRKGDRVAMVVPDGDEFVLSFLGALFAGVVPVPIYPQLSFKNVEGYHDTVAHIARASGATMLLTTAATRPFVEPVAAARADAPASIATVDELAARTPGKLDVARRRRRTSRSSSSRAAAPRAPRASWSPTATSPRTPRRS